MPTRANSSFVISECVVEDGWMTKDFTSATLAKSEKIFKLSMKVFAYFSPPTTSNVNMDPPPFGKYFLYNSCCFKSLVMDG